MSAVNAMRHRERISTRSPQCSTRRSQAGERYTASFAAEQTDFVRMNRGKVRQPGTVAQRYLARAADPRRSATRRTCCR